MSFKVFAKYSEVTTYGLFFIHSILRIFQINPYIIQVKVMVKAYVNIKLPEELAKKVDKLVKERTLGYRSR
jgi:hypothetical protein